MHSTIKSALADAATNLETVADELRDLPDHIRTLVEAVPDSEFQRLADSQIDRCAEASAGFMAMAARLQMLIGAPEIK